MNRKAIKLILGLNWKKLTTFQELTELMYLSWIAATEFAQSLRLALEVYKDDKMLQKLAKEELHTNNLRFKGYKDRADHSDFLFYFLSTIKMFDTNACVEPGMLRPEVIKVGREYMRRVEMIKKSTRVMSIPSREKELSGFFAQILKNPLFKAKNLPLHLQAYKYFLERHIRIDSKPGGHRDLSKHITVTDKVEVFYNIRLAMYVDAFSQLRTKEVSRY